MRVAWVNMCAYRSETGNEKSFSEPVHLLAMHGICQRAGHQSQIHQFGSPSNERSIRSIVESRPDVLGLSFIGRDKEAIDGARKIFSAFSRAMPRIIVGGTDVGRYPDLYFKKLFSGDSIPLFPIFVNGPGEGAIKQLAAVNFNLKEIKTGFISYGGVAFLGPEAPIPLDQQSFLRPYPDLFAFNQHAQAKWAQGCWGSCGFCPNEKRPVDFRSPSLVLKEIDHLKSLNAARIMTAAENFTVDPGRASDIAAVLPRKDAPYYLFTSRVDSLYKAITERPSAWKGLCARIDLGVESTLEERLGPDRLHKYNSVHEAQLQEARLEYILDFFKDEKVLIETYLIPYDWRMTLEELQMEADKIIAFGRKYSGQVRLLLRSLHRILHYEEGSPLAKTMDWTDFYRFERDPRTLMLALLMEQKVNELFRDYGSKIEMEENAIALLMWDYLRSCIDIMKKIPTSRFHLQPIIDIMSEKNSFEEALAEMYAQLGNEEAARLRQELNAGFSQVSKAARKLIIKVLPFPLDALWAATRLITKAR